MHLAAQSSFLTWSLISKLQGQGPSLQPMLCKKATVASLHPLEEFALFPGTHPSTCPYRVQLGLQPRGLSQ